MKPNTKHTKSLLIKKQLILSMLAILVVLSISGVVVAFRTKTQVKELFKMNKELTEQGYYMAEFEFKMLGIAYYLDKGRFFQSLSQINQLHSQLKFRKDLIKIPPFTSPEDELEFYLNLQNPRTEAFMDDSYPLCTYHGPTENVLLHIEALAEETGQPLHLKYPLKYLDQINTPEKLIAFLDDVSTVGWIASKLPQTTFHNARDILSLARDPINYNENEVQLVILKNNLYHFSTEWKQALLQWFYDAQDPETGLWGPKSKNGTLLKKDLNNTASIMKAFVDKDGNNIHPSFPLRYKNELFVSILEELSDTSMPADDELAEWHEWHLKTLKGIRTLTRYLWNGSSPENREKAKALIENFIRIKFEKYYIPAEGSFSYYPRGDHATLDGAGGLFIFNEIGAFSSKKQEKLWGTPEKNIIDSGTFDIAELMPDEFDGLNIAQNINSLRFYQYNPDDKNLASGVFAVVYPQQTVFLDIIELAQNMNHWMHTTPQSMGNWVSKVSVRKLLESINSEHAAIHTDGIPVEKANHILKKNGELVVIGFDCLQIPIYKVVFKYSSE